MNRSLSLALLINRTWMAFFIISSLNSQSVPGGDMLTETPLYPVPAEMTFEEYQDMNRRLTIGLALTSIPIPGIVHRYAGEKKKARRLFMIGAGGLGLVIAGASMMGEEEWPESDYNLMILNAGEDNEIRYEKIPINQFGDDIEYKLIPMNKQRDGSGGGLIILGALVLVGDIFYDWLHGWKMIINKRDAVRYKYGQQIQVSVRPEVNLNTQSAGINFRLFF
ncbi:MAG: hypothetical protein HOI72_01055 [Candidatus Marinimicrobia bacterium]|nr:hypothetical protein [Candidatus Neomarinimicrobiota bacterium]MBT6981716.1 hypothetical protein [Candidatus Neomarinimicrobiota bacterium]